MLERLLTMSVVMPANRTVINTNPAQRAAGSENIVINYKEIGKELVGWTFATTLLSGLAANRYLSNHYFDGLLLTLITIPLIFRTYQCYSKLR